MDVFLFLGENFFQFKVFLIKLHELSFFLLNSEFKILNGLLFMGLEFAQVFEFLFVKSEIVLVPFDIFESGFLFLIVLVDSLFYIWEFQRLEFFLFWKFFNFFS